jgi:glutathione synthase/RimK-type ligase-like ATP-grasp enzyme
MPEPTPSDALLAAALEARGSRVRALPWDEIIPARWAGALVCVRSTWDYHLRAAEFRAWASSFRDSAARLCNPPETILWNLDKGYLDQLNGSGVPIPATVWLAPGAPIDLSELLARTGWRRAVLKPRVSASAHGTILVTPDSALAPEQQQRLSAGALLQEFIPEVQTLGEISLMFFGGAYSHAVCKEAAPGEFRVQPHLGGTARRVEATAELRAFAARVLAEVPSAWVYARVDVVPAERGPLLMEVELVEPELFFTLAPEAAHGLAEAMLPG